MSDTNDAKQVQNEVRNNIFTLFGIDKMPEDEQEKEIEKIIHLIFQKVLLRILPDMEEKDLNTFETKMEENVETEELFQFLLEKEPRFLEIFLEEAETLRKDAEKYLG